MHIPTQTEPIRRHQRFCPFRDIEPDENGVYPAQMIDDLDDFEEDEE